MTWRVTVKCNGTNGSYTKKQDFEDEPTSDQVKQCRLDAKKEYSNIHRGNSRTEDVTVAPHGRGETSLV